MSSPAGQSLIAQGAWNLAAGVALIGGRFAASIIVARTLGPERGGQLIYVLWAAELAGQVLAAAFTASLTRSTAELVGRGDVAQQFALRRWALKIFVPLAGLGALATALLGRHGGGLDAPPLIALAAFFYLLQTLWSLNQAEFAAEGRFATNARLNTGGGLALVAAALVASRFDTVAATLAAYLIGAAVPAVVGRWQLGAGRGTPVLAPETRRALLRFAAHSWLAIVLSAFVWGRLEIWFLERFRSTREVAFFSVALSLVTLASQGPVLLADVLMPRFAQLAGAGRAEEILAAHRQATRLTALLLFPLALGGAAVTGVLLPLLYGAAFAPAAGPATVLVAAGVVQLGVTNAALIRGLGRADFIALASALGAVAALALGWLVIPAAGLWGAAWLRASLQVAMTAAGFWFVAGPLRAAIEWPVLLRTLLAAAAAAATARGLVVLWATPAGLVAAVTGAVGVYLGALRLSAVVAADDVATLTRFLARWPATLGSPAGRVLRWVSPS